MKLSKKIAVTAIALSSVITANSVQAASTLSGDLNIDDAYNAYISVDNSTQGTAISNDSVWNSVTSFSNVSLAAGTDYFLHVFGINSGGGKTGFIGDFTIAGSDHTFGDNSTFATTGNLWQASATGWDGYSAITERDSSGIPAAADLTGIDPTALWIWDSNDQVVDDKVFFTLKINAVQTSSAVPEPGVTLLIASGLLAFAGARKKLIKA